MSRNYFICEGCGEALDVSDRYYPVPEGVLCIECAPTFMDLLSEPTSFVERDDDRMPLSREKREAMLDAHIAAGGHPQDSMATRAVE
ncbi:MAG TPA: hypothetical protein VGN75_09335 [Kaistia sp.]|jgi:hypothetical protein|nr:hypothetical protein [Kaistia sp.]